MNCTREHSHKVYEVLRKIVLLQHELFSCFNIYFVSASLFSSIFSILYPKYIHYPSSGHLQNKPLQTLSPKPVNQTCPSDILISNLVPHVPATSSLALCLHPLHPACASFFTSLVHFFVLCIDETHLTQLHYFCSLSFKHVIYLASTDFSIPPPFLYSQISVVREHHSPLV